jgi:hypothetical protein
MRLQIQAILPVAVLTITAIKMLHPGKPGKILCVNLRNQREIKITPVLLL